MVGVCRWVRQGHAELLAPASCRADEGRPGSRALRAHPGGHSRESLTSWPVKDTHRRALLPTSEPSESLCLSPHQKPPSVQNSSPAEGGFRCKKKILVCHSSTVLYLSSDPDQPPHTHPEKKGKIPF